MAVVVVGMGTIVKAVKTANPPADVVMLPFELMSTLSLDAGVVPGSFVPLATLSDDDRAFIDALLNRTLARPDILAAIRDRFPQGRRGGVGRC